MADNTTTQLPEEKALRELLECGAGEGSGKEEVPPPPAPAPPKDSPPKPEEEYLVFALYKECMGLAKSLPGPVEGAFAKLVKSNQPVWPGGKLSDDKKKEVVDKLGSKQNRLECLKAAMRHLLEIAKQRDDYQKQVEKTRKAEVQPPIEQPTPPAPTKSATPTKPEWEALPLWAKWTIGGGSAVIVGVMAWVFYAVISM